MFRHANEDIFHANFDAHLKKQLKQNSMINFGHSNLSMFFKAKIKFGNAPVRGKQFTIGHDFARQMVRQNAQKYSHNNNQN